MATCPSCRRHRVLVEGADGVSRCEVCTVNGERPCETCKAQMPAGRGKECENCYWRKLFDKRVAINSRGFSSDEFGQEFIRFGKWLLDRIGEHKAALNINGHYRFFREIETTWGEIPTYRELLEQFGAGGLRRAETPMRWLAEQQAVIVKADLRDQHTERRRVEAVMAELEEPWAHQIAKEYCSMLTARMESGRLNLRSIRLSMRAAVNLLAGARLSVGQLPSQDMIKSFWRGSPGQVAAVTGFISYLNSRFDLKLNAKPDARWLAKAKQYKSESELLGMLADDQQEDFEARWVVKALAHFHGIARVNRKTLVYQSQDYRDTAGFNVEHSGRTLWVPAATSYRRGNPAS